MLAQRSHVDLSSSNLEITQYERRERLYDKGGSKSEEMQRQGFSLLWY